MEQRQHNTLLRGLLTAHAAMQKQRDKDIALMNDARSSNASSGARDSNQALDRLIAFLDVAHAPAKTVARCMVDHCDSVLSLCAACPSPPKQPARGRVC